MTIRTRSTRTLLAAAAPYAGALGTACAADGGTTAASAQPQTPWPSGRPKQKAI